MTKEVVKKYSEKVVQWRRRFHENPEVSMKEFETAKFIENELEKAGIKHKRVGDTGVVAIIGDTSKKGVALRGDMDALQVQEGKDVPYASKVDGVMHACGHDAHAAMLLGAAMALKECENQLNGFVKCYFQPGEEVAQGAKMMIKEEPLTNVVSSFALHVASYLPVGTAAFDPGPRMASADIFDITIEGKGGHGSLPNQGVDAALVSAAVLMNLQSIVSREVSPLRKSVVSVGSIESGSRFNVIASKGVLKGTTRAFDKEVRDTFEDSIRRIVEGTCKAYRAKGTLNYIYGTNPCVNDEFDTSVANEVLVSLYGEEAIETREPSTGGEDFCYFVGETGGVMGFLGSGNKEKDTCYSHHHSNFDIDEDALEMGTNLYVKYAIEILKKKG